jgi:hypothetical protein
MALFSRKELGNSFDLQSTVIIENTRTGDIQEVSLGDYLTISVTEHMQKIAEIRAANLQPEKPRRLPRTAIVFKVPVLRQLAKISR